MHVQLYCTFKIIALSVRKTERLCLIIFQSPQSWNSEYVQVTCVLHEAHWQRYNSRRKRLQLELSNTNLSILHVSANILLIPTSLLSFRKFPVGNVVCKNSLAIHVLKEPLDIYHHVQPNRWD